MEKIFKNKYMASFDLPENSDEKIEIDELIGFINDMKEEGATKFAIEFEPSYEEEYLNSNCISAYKKELETDEEYERRIEDDKRYQESQKGRLHKRYLELKEMFEPNAPNPNN